MRHPDAMSTHASFTRAAPLGLLAFTLASGLGALPTPTGAQEAPEPTGAALRPGQLPDPGEPRFGTGGWRTDFSISSVRFDEITSGGPPKDGIPAIDAPVFGSIADARTWMDGLSPVIALEVGGEAKAYPMAILTWHEIVNDTLGGEPVTVTFCPLCNTAIAFARTVDGVVHDFGTAATSSTATSSCTTGRPNRGGSRPPVPPSWASRWARGSRRCPPRSSRSTRSRPPTRTARC
jgi:hypothetical protein